MPGNMQQAALECGCCETVYPCECRIDISHSFYGYLLSGGSFCSINPMFGSLIAGVPGAVDPADYAWCDEWPCIYHAVMTFKITAFPPLCVDPDTSRLVVLVKKTTNCIAPLIDNDAVGINEWYCVVYDSDGSGPLGIFYEYDICCKNETPTDPATSHLVSVSFFNVEIGDGVWDLEWINLTTRDTYGDCE